MWLIILLILSVAFIVVATAYLRLHPALALLAAAFGYGLCSGAMAPVKVAEAVNAGFGATLGSIGIVILAGTIIGIFLERSGGAMRLAEATLRLFGSRRVPWAMGGLGYIVSIPVFCDSAFVLLSPLNRALARRAGLSLAPCAIALALGLYATHTMVPPTPGPVAAAGLLDADLGRVVGWGMLVAVVGLIAGVLFARWAGGRVWIDPKETLEGAETAPDAADLQQRPGLVLSVLPIALPIALILARSLAGVLTDTGSFWIMLINFLGQPVVALLIGVAIAAWLPRHWTRDMFGANGWVGEAVLAAAGIILITGCGGAFGKVLQESGIAKVVESGFGTWQLGLLLPFLFAAALKTAQGSSTVAIITTAGILAPMLPALGLDDPNARALAVVAIGAGSMVVSHANDSYFWVVTQFSGMSVQQGYRLHTLGTLVQGCVSGAAVWLLGWLT
ncbi:MAG: GntP family permease [Candidatus Hydrogenedentes bacterium]|nr:GntP family permease [Candidatus Hydrogenedentota bacterium]